MPKTAGSHLSSPMSNRLPKPRRSAQWLCRCVWNAFAMVGICTCLYASCFTVTRVTSGSMSPTLVGESFERGDVLLTEKLNYRFRNPRRWEVVLVRAADNNLVVKRVVGLPGESIQLPMRGKIKIDGRELPLPDGLRHLEHLPFGNVMAGQTVECGEGYYLLGDDSLDSDDSRFNGPIDPSRIVGRAWVILGPSSRRGCVNI